MTTDGPRSATGLPGASGLDEEPVYLTVGTERIFGILTRPIVAPSGLGVICLHARNRNNTAHRNRTGMRLSRELSAIGVYSLRVDFYGTGDSTGVLQRGATGQVGDDLLAAVDLLRQQGATRIAVAGICFGGLVALATAERIPELTGLFMVSAPLATVRPGRSIKQQHDKISAVARQTVRGSTLRLLVRDQEYRAWFLHRVRLRVRLARQRRRPAPTTNPAVAPGHDPGESPLLARIRTLGMALDRGVEVRLLFAEADRVYRDFSAARSGPLGQLLERPRISVVVTPGNEFGLLTSLTGQDTIIRSTLDWATDLSRAPGPTHAQ